jgi:hypothetical protein
MKESFTELNYRFRRALTQFLWDQWASIGVAGAVDGKREIPFTIDPEALLLATTRFGMDEARLPAEVLDWLIVNGKTIRLQRLKNLQLEHGIGSVIVLEEMGEILAESGHKNWQIFKGLRGDDERRDPIPGSPKAIDLRELTLRKMSQKPNPYARQAFLFRMRSFFGMNARAEVFTWLLTHDGGHAAAIARETGWFSKTVQLTLNELAQSGVVSVLQQEEIKNRERIFRIDREPWQFLMPRTGELHWFSQAPFYLGCRQVLETLDSLEGAGESSTRFLALKIRETLDSTAVSFERAGLGELFGVEARFTGDHLVESYRLAVEGIVHCLTSPIECIGRRPPSLQSRRRTERR